MRTLQRQWLLLSRIPRAPRTIDVTTLASELRDAGHPIHRRTLQRDLVALSRILPLVCDERKKPYAWSWSRDAVGLQVESMGPHVALLFQIAAHALQPVLPPETRRFIERHLHTADGVLSGTQSDLATWVQRLQTHADPDGTPHVEIRLVADERARRTK